MVVTVPSGRDLARHIPGARYIELPGTDHLWWVGDQDELLDPVEAFLTETDEGDDVLATVLWIAGAEDVLATELERHGGRPVGRTGGGALAAFESPTRALRYAAAAMRDGSRAAVHIGECHRVRDSLTGAAVDRAAELGALAAPGELLVSSVVAELAAGSGVALEERGERRLAGGDAVRVLAHALAS